VWEAAVRQLRDLTRDKGVLRHETRGAKPLPGNKKKTEITALLRKEGRPMVKVGGKSCRHAQVPKNMGDKRRGGGKKVVGYESLSLQKTCGETRKV